jgi:hypothetical protein
MKTRTVSIFFLVLIASCFAQNQHPLQTDARLPGLDLDNASPWAAVAKILRYAKIPGGVVRVMSCGEIAKSSFNVAGMTVPEALNYVLSFDKAYTWKFQDGAINVFPTAAVPDLLTVQINKLVVTDGNVLASAVTSTLLADPQVKTRAAELKLKRAVQSFGLQTVGEPTIRIDLHEVSVQQALNSIALKHGTAVWQYTEIHCGNENEFGVDWVVH